MPNLIFDFDGTLCDSYDVFIEAINARADEFGFKKITKENAPHLRKLTTREVMQSVGLSIIKLPFVVKKVRADLKLQTALLQPFPGIASVLKALKQRGATLIILTSNSEDVVRSFLMKHEIEVFEHVYCGTSVFGKSRMLKKVLHELDLDKKSTYYIGDETRDVEAARSAGIEPVSVAWGYADKQTLLALTPKHLVEKPEDLFKLL